MHGDKTEDGMRRLTGPGSDASGQMSLDFLMGVIIFLMTFVFVFMYATDMLMPFQSNSDELTMTADRIGTEMVENLLLDNPSMPNVINCSKYVEIASQLNNPIYCQRIGAYSNRPYNVNMSLILSNNSVYSGGPVYPKGSLNVGQSKRIVVDKISGKLGMLYVTVW